MLNITTYKTAYLIGNRKNMIMSQHKLCRFLTICLLCVSSSAYAATDSNTAYVDSVHGWGAWELGLEPAAGGPAPTSNRALPARGTNVKFRPNDNSAFSPNSNSVAITTTRPTPTPAPIPIPTAGALPPGADGTSAPGDR